MRKFKQVSTSISHRKQPKQGWMWKKQLFCFKVIQYQTIENLSKMTKQIPTFKN